MVAENELLLSSEQHIHIPRGLEPEIAQGIANNPILGSLGVKIASPTDPTAGAAPRADLQHLLTRQAFTLDASRAEAMAKRHAQGLRSARENIADLCDPGSFIEYGALAVAAQRSRRSEQARTAVRGQRAAQ